MAGTPEKKGGFIKNLMERFADIKDNIELFKMIFGPARSAISETLAGSGGKEGIALKEAEEEREYYRKQLKRLEKRTKTGVSGLGYMLGSKIRENYISTSNTKTSIEERDEKMKELERKIKYRDGVIKKIIKNMGTPPTPATGGTPTTP